MTDFPYTGLYVWAAAVCLLMSALLGYFRDRDKFYDALSTQFLFVALGAVLGLVGEILRR